MGWPKGVKRKGYVRKDGTAHAARGDGNKKPERPVIAPVVEETPKPEPVLHGAGSMAITEPCPQCLYAYADGGYCPECGWSLPIVRLPYGTAGNRLR